MAFLGALVGGGSQNAGTNFQAQSAPIQAQPGLATPVTSDQAASAVQGANGTINQQNALLSQQNYAVAQQAGLASALSNQNGIGNQSSVYNQQQGLANQLGQLAQGQGPNPAQAQLAQNTSANTSNQAALMAGQRGAGSNSGLIARQAAQQGAANQQNSIGQAATLQAQQQLAAIGALQQQQGMLGNLATQQVGQQQNAYNANVAGAQGLSQSAGNLTAASQAQQGQLLGQVNNQNSQALQATQQANQANLANIASQNSSNAGVAQTNINQSAQTGRGLLNGIGSVATSLLAEGGQIGSNAILKENYKGKSKVGMHLFAKGGKAHKLIDALVSPGEKILTPEQAKKAKAGKQSPMNAKTVPGKPRVGGAVNSYANDTVPMKLAAGSIVIPRAVTQSPDAHEKAKKFVAALKSRK